MTLILHHLCSTSLNEMTLKRNIDGKVKNVDGVYFLCSSVCLLALQQWTMSLRCFSVVGWNVYSRLFLIEKRNWRWKYFQSSFPPKINFFILRVASNNFFIPIPIIKFKAFLSLFNKYRVEYCNIPPHFSEKIIN